MRLALLRVVPLVIAGSFVFACSSAPTPQQGERTAQTGERIIHGKPSDSSQDAVVLIEQVTMGYACSGTLLAPNLVLTARHCVSNLASEGVQCDASGNGTASSAIGADFVPGTLYIYVGATRPAGFGGKPAAKGQKIIHDNATNLCNHDLALILLDTSIPNAKIAQIRLDSPPVMSDTITAVGWGVSETAAEPPQRLQRTGIPITVIGPSSTGLLPTPPNNFQVGEAFCQGDSGGPGYAESTGAIVGVVSFGGNGSGMGTQSQPWLGCIDNGNGVYNFYTRVDGFADLIRQAGMEAGQDPWVEGGPDPRLAKFGDGCGQNSDCQSSLCTFDSMGNGTCTQDCTQNACPDGYDCKNDSNAGTKICLMPGQGNGNNNGNGSSTVTAKGCAAAPSGDASSGAAFLALAGLAAAVTRRGSRADRRASSPAPRRERARS